MKAKLIFNLVRVKPAEPSPIKKAFKMIIRKNRRATLVQSFANKLDKSKQRILVQNMTKDFEKLKRVPIKSYFYDLLDKCKSPLRPSWNQKLMQSPLRE